MGWVNQSRVVARHGWVATMPRPSCPLTALVGACCSGCAEGRGCSAEEELPHAHVGEVSTAEWGDAYPWSLADEMNGQVERLNSDLATALKQTPGGSPEWVAMTTEWGTFYPAWRQWYDTYRNDWKASILPISGAIKPQFDDLVKRFNDAIAHAKTLGVQTTAAPTDTRTGIRKVIDSASQGIQSGSEAIANALTQAGFYVAVGGAVLLGLYIAGPSLISYARKALPRA